MKKKDLLKYHQSSAQELNAKIAELQNELVTSRQLIKLGKSKNTRAAKNIRLQIAVLKTIAHSKIQKGAN